MVSQKPDRLIAELMLAGEVIRQRCELLKLAQNPKRLDVGEQMLEAIRQEMTARQLWRDVEHFPRLQTENLEMAARVQSQIAPGQKLYGCLITVDLTDPWKLEVK